MWFLFRLPGLPVHHAMHVAAPPDDAGWARAPVLEFATDWRGGATTHHTRVRLAWSDAALYARFEVEETDLNTDRSRPVDQERVDLYEEDCVELFLAPDRTRPHRYAEIEIGPYGHFFDLWIDRDAKTSDATWSAGLTIHAAPDRDRHRAVIDVAIAAPEIAGALKPGAEMHFDVFRMEGKRHYLAAYPTNTPRPKFHVPDAFGTLVLDP